MSRIGPIWNRWRLTMPNPCEEACFATYQAESQAAWDTFWLDYAACNGNPACIATAKAKRDAALEEAKLRADYCIENCNGA